METSKDTLRRAMRAQRAALDAATVACADLRLAERLATFRPYLEADVVLAYVAKDNEVPTESLIRNALSCGKRVYLPRIAENWFGRHRSAANLRPGALGLLEPASPEDLAPDWKRGLVLVPLLAWTDLGDRLGRGGGWYDRILPRLGMPAIGIGYEFQKREHVPTEPSDVRLDYVVTENRLVECGRVLSEGDLHRWRSAV